MPRRSNGEGTVRRRPDGRWEGRLRYTDPDTGLIDRLSVYGKEKGDVTRQLREAAQRLSAGERPRQESAPLADFLEHWLESAVKPTRKDSTYRNYRWIIEGTIYPLPIARVAIGSLRASAIQRDLVRSDDRARSRALALKILKHALRDAVDWGLIHRNPAAAVKPPRVAKKELTVWTAEQAGKFLNVAADDPFFALYFLALYTGMRQGELLALRWSDVDLERGTLRVVRTLDSVTMKATEPKTKSARRTIELAQAAIDVLRAHRERTGGHGLLFPNEVGTPINARNLVRRNFEPLIDRTNARITEEAKKAGVKPEPIPRIRFHDLRHTAATLMLQGGVHPKVVSERLGHSSITITMDVYQHVLPSMQRAATAAVEKLLQTQTGVGMVVKPALTADVRKQKKPRNP